MRETSVEALLLMAALYAGHDKHKKAVTLLMALHELAPDDERVLPPLCHSLVQLKEFAKTQEFMPTLLAQSREGSLQNRICALRLHAAVLWGLERKSEAKAVLEQCTHLMDTLRKEGSQ